MPKAEDVILKLFAALDAAETKAEPSRIDNLSFSHALYKYFMAPSGRYFRRKTWPKGTFVKLKDGILTTYRRKQDGSKGYEYNPLSIYSDEHIYADWSVVTTKKKQD